MLYLKGTPLHQFHTPAGTNKQGESYDARTKIQILAAIPLQNGEYRNDLITLTCQPNLFDSLIGTECMIPIGVLPNGNTITYYMPKGTKPFLASNSATKT
jgi:hypothetical protein